MTFNKFLVQYFLHMQKNKVQDKKKLLLCDLANERLQIYAVQAKNWITYDKGNMKSDSKTKGSVELTGLETDTEETVNIMKLLNMDKWHLGLKNGTKTLCGKQDAAWLAVKVTLSYLSMSMSESVGLMSAKPAAVEAGLLGRESHLLYHAVMTTLSLPSANI